MISQIVLNSNLDSQKDYFQRLLSENNINFDHPDVLFLDEEQKLGIETVKKIQEFLTFKPYSLDKKIILILAGERLTVDAQNAFLKTLEEPPAFAQIIIGAENEHNFLETVLSRCQIVRLDDLQIPHSQRSVQTKSKFQNPNLEDLTIEERFALVEKADKDQLFDQILQTYHQKAQTDEKYFGLLKILQQASEMKNSNVNLRTILEYIMLEIPKKSN